MIDLEPDVLVTAIRTFGGVYLVCEDTSGYEHFAKVSSLRKRGATVPVSPRFSRVVSSAAITSEGRRPVERISEHDGFPLGGSLYIEGGRFTESVTLSSTVELHGGFVVEDIPKDQAWLALTSTHAFFSDGQAPVVSLLEWGHTAPATVEVPDDSLIVRLTRSLALETRGLDEFPGWRPVVEEQFLAVVERESERAGLSKPVFEGFASAGLSTSPVLSNAPARNGWLLPRTSAASLRIQELLDGLCTVCGAPGVPVPLHDTVNDIPVRRIRCQKHEEDPA